MRYLFIYDSSVDCIIDTVLGFSLKKGIMFDFHTVLHVLDISV